ncbi:MAG: hypothetical protein A2W38_05705 [Deltaproteobacteria bacterium RBG_19FT_COMBO_58_16]|nr:MAG: hypothetical protein A2W38_05705 [Deltaproteobacteria bacterium RBG_19FT_COMBO_58_16]
MLNCDFCGRETDSVIRVALDKDYDRLSVRHEKRYACPECSEKKEKERQDTLKAAAATQDECRQ